MKKRISRLAAVLLSSTMLIGSFSAFAEESCPTQWDLTHIYADETAWQADYDKAMDMLDTYDEFRGTLGSVQGLCDYLEFAHGGQLTEIKNKLDMYATIGYYRDGTDPVYQSMLMKYDMLKSAESQASAFFEEELCAIPFEERQALIQDPLLEEWSYYLEDYLDPDRIVYSEETNSALAVLGMDSGRSEQAAEILWDVDMPNPVITLPSGEEVAITDAEYLNISSDSSYDRELKKEVLRLHMTETLPYINTITALFEGTVMENWAKAQLKGYESSRAAALDENDVEPEVYDLLIEAAHAGAEDYQRYLKLHAEALGLDEQYPFDLYTSISTFEKNDTPYDTAVEEVREALSVMGEDYLAYYDMLMADGYIDAYPAEGKTEGSFCASNGIGTWPYQLFNYTGSVSDAGIIAHEMGHAVYYCYAQENQPIEYSSPGVFTQEVVSTTNELLFYSYMMEHAENDEEKLFYLEQVLQLFNGSFFSQTLYAEFEDQMYATVENGESLDAEALSAYWAQLQQLYEGDAVTELPETAYYWSQIPHFHYNFYVYQYATSMIYAASVYAQLSGEEAQTAIENYIAFQKAGASAKPSQLLSMAGIDPLDPETYNSALAYYSSLIDEYETLLQSRSAE